MNSPKEYTETPRLLSHKTFHTTYPYCILLFPSQFMSDRIYSRFQLQSKPGTLSEAGWFRFAPTVYAMLTLSIYGLDDIYQTARSLYRCMLSCKDAFPSSLTQNTWAKNLWEEACYRTIVHPSPNLFRQDEEACLFLGHIWHSFT